MKIVKSFKGSCLLIKGVSKGSCLLIKGVIQTIKNEVKEQKRAFLGMLLGTLGASLLENLLTGKCTIRADEGAIRTGQDF